LPKVVTQRCLEQDLNLRPTDRKPKCLTVTPPRHQHLGVHAGISNARLSTGQKIDWEEHAQNDRFCVEWDVKP